MERKVYVYLDLNGNLVPVGQLFARSVRGKEGASFQHERSWLSNPAQIEYK